MHYKKTITEIYPGIALWCSENNITSSKQLQIFLSEKGLNISYHMLLTRLSGQTEFTRSEIDFFLKMTGQPFESLFKQLGE